jgi:DNA-binding response OmpR family regulator
VLAPNVPVIVVSANSEIEQKVLLLELGADDYVTKPFSPKELLARVRRAMRRKVHALAVETRNGKWHETLSFGNVYVDFSTMEVTRDGKPVQITAQEFRVLKFLARFPGHVISRDNLLDELRGYREDSFTRAVDNHILRLRQKLEPDPSTPRYLLTIHGAGYKFVPDGFGPLCTVLPRSS